MWVGLIVEGPVRGVIVLEISISRKLLVVVFLTVSSGRCRIVGGIE